MTNHACESQAESRTQLNLRTHTLTSSENTTDMTSMSVTKVVSWQISHMLPANIEARTGHINLTWRQGQVKKWHQASTNSRGPKKQHLPNTFNWHLSLWHHSPPPASARKRLRTEATSNIRVTTWVKLRWIDINVHVWIPDMKRQPVPNWNCLRFLRQMQRSIRTYSMAKSMAKIEKAPKFTQPRRPE